MILQSWKKVQVIKKKAFLKKSPSSLYVQIRSSRRYAEILK